MTDKTLAFIYERDMAAENEWLRGHIEILQLYLETSQLRTERGLQLAESFRDMLAKSNSMLEGANARYESLLTHVWGLLGYEWVDE